MSLYFLLSLAFSLHFLSLLPGSNSLPIIGVTYSAGATLSPPPSDRVSSAVNSLTLSSLRLIVPDPIIVRSFLYSNTTILLTVPNVLVAPIASNRSNAVQWLYTFVVPFFPRAKITTISVGNDLLETSPELSPFLLPAMRNIHLGLRDLGIRKIAVSTTFSFVNVITSFFPPSAAQFQEPAYGNVISPMLQFLRDTNSSFLINIYPYNVYRMRSEIPIGFALFQQHPFGFRDDLTTGVRYRNLFDMMVDAVICAMAISGHENIPVVVTETGWPSWSGDGSEVDANPVYAELYLKGLVKHLRSGLGTPLRKDGVAETYIFELFDEEEKPEKSNERRHWGILYPNMTKKFRIDFSGSAMIFGSRGLLELAIGFSLIFALFHGSSLL
ncbi:hypothetical protein UlMin_025504 [Ulmus minor]